LYLSPRSCPGIHSSIHFSVLTPLSFSLHHIGFVAQP
jgi:hypothetical protein